MRWNVKRISAKSLYFIELFLAVILSLFCFFGQMNEDNGLILSGFLQFIPSVIYLIILVLLILEWIIEKKSPLRRGLYLVSTFVVAFFMYNEGKLLSLYNVTLWLFSIPFVVIVIVTIIRNSSIKDSSNNEGKKTLPIGYFSIEQVKIRNLSLIIFVFLILGTVILTSYLDSLVLSIVLSILIAIFSIGILFYVLVIKNPLNEAINSINNQLSYHDLKNKIDDLRKNNIHPENENHLNIIMANYSVVEDKNESFEYFKTCKEPTIKSYVNIYKIIQINYYINSNNFDEAKKLISKLGRDKKNKKIIQALEREIIISSSNEIIENVESFYPLDNKILFTNVSNCFCLMKYYYTRGNKEKALVYAHKLLDYHSDFTYYISFAIQVVDELENGVTYHKMNLNDEPYVLIKDGSKTIEMRLNDEKRSKIKVGDKIEFTNNVSKEKLIVKVTNLYHYKSFQELYLNHDKISIGYKENEEAKPEDMEVYYNKENIEKYGVLAIEISVD